MKTPALASRSSTISRSAVFERWAPRILIALAAAVPLVFDFSLYDTFDLPKMTLVYAAVLALLGLWLWQQSSGGWMFRPNGITLPLVVFLVSALLSCHASIDLSRSLFGAYRTYVYGWIPLAAFGLLCFLASQIQAEEAAIRVAVAALVGGSAASLYGLLQYTGNEIFELMPRVVQGRAWSSLGNPIYLGAVAAMALPLAWRRRHLASMVGLVVILTGLAISLSRSAWLGSFAAMVFLLLVFRRRVKMNRFQIGGGVLVIILLGVLIPKTRERLRLTLSTRESSNAARVEGWKGGVQVWRRHPFLGTGPDTFFEAFRPYRNQAFIESAGIEVTQAHAHNEVIQVASTLGSLGLAAWGWFCLAYLRRLRIIFQEDPQVLSSIRPFLVASLIAAMVQNQFNPSSAATAAWTALLAGLAIRHGAARALPWPRWPLAVRAGLVGFLMIAGLGLISIPLRADYLYKKGIVREANGKLVDALADYQAAVRIRPDIEAYQTTLGNAARSLAQLSPDGAQRRAFWDIAMKAAQDSVLRHPFNPDAWNDLGVADMWLTQLSGDNRMTDAKTSFEKAIALDPVFIDAWANLAKWSHIAGDLEGEKRLWRQVLRLNPEEPMALQVLGQPGASPS